MKTIYVVRHARAHAKGIYLSDAERTLTDAGRQDARQIGKMLRDKNTVPDLILSSTAKRALETAYILADEMHYSRAKIDMRQSLYDIKFEDLLNILSGLDDRYQSVMFVGHNPPMSTMSDYLTQYGVGNLAPGSVFCCEFKVDTWKAISKYGGICKFLEVPKN